MSDTKSLEEFSKENKVKSSVIVGKPRFEKKTKAVVIGEEFSVGKELQDANNVNYNPVNWNVTISCEYNKEPLMFTENIKGLKLYKDEDGSYMTQCSEKSRAGRVLVLLRMAGAEWDGTLEGIKGMLLNRTGKIISEEWSMGDKKGFYNAFVDLD